MKIGDSITFGNFDWLVLEVQEDRALLLTKEIVGQRPYHNLSGDVTWAESELRSYLNNTFYETFNEKEQKKIIPVFNKNQDNQWYGTLGGKDTEDKLFLLSLEEVACRYFGDSSALLYNPGKNQKYWFQRKDTNNFKREAYFKEYGWWWWLRSPGRSSKRAVYIWGDGTIGIQGNGTFHYNSNTIHPSTEDNSGGIRPALWMKLENESLE